MTPYDDTPTELRALERYLRRRHPVFAARLALIRLGEGQSLGDLAFLAWASTSFAAASALTLRTLWPEAFALPHLF